MAWKYFHVGTHFVPDNNKTFLDKQQNSLQTNFVLSFICLYCLTDLIE